MLAAVGDRRAHRILAKADIDGVIGIGLVLGVSTFAISLFLALVPPAGVSWLVFGGVLVAVAALTGWIDRSASIVPFAASVVTLAAVLVMVISVMDSRGDSLDVMVFQSEGTEAILSGDNPYGIRFVNPYSPADSPTSMILRSRRTASSSSDSHIRQRVWRRSYRSRPPSVTSDSPRLPHT